MMWQFHFSLEKSPGTARTPGVSLHPWVIWHPFACKSLLLGVCVCVFIVSSVIMGQSSSTPLSVMTDHEDQESQKKKPIPQETSLYPSLIDLDTEISPPS